MKSLAIIQQDVQPLLREVEAIRKPFMVLKTISQLAIVMMVVLALSVGGGFFIFSTQIEQWILRHPGDIYLYNYAMYGLFFVIVLTTPIYSWFGQLYQKQTVIVTKLIEAVIPSELRYTAGSVSETEVTQSGLFTYFRSDNRNYVTSKGLVTGSIEGVAFKFTDMTILSKRGLWWYRIPYLNMLLMAGKYLQSVKRQTAYMDYSKFKGLFMVAEFPKTITGRTVVLPDVLEKKLGYIAKTIQKLNFKRSDLVHLENPIFEQEFVVYSTDQVQARYALSTTMMERILEWKQKINKPIMLSFVDRYLYVAVIDPTGVFDLPLGTNVTKSGTLEKMYNDVRYALDIVQDLRLNVKLWQ